MVDLYKESYTSALLRGRAEEWNESFYENRRCAEFLTELANENDSFPSELPISCLEETVKEFGYDRTMWVIANSVAMPENRDRADREIRDWAQDMGVIVGDENFELDCDSFLVNCLAKQVQQLYAKIDFYGIEDVTDPSKQENFEDKIILLRPSTLKEEYRTKENQLFYATSGNGCDPTKIGRKVFGFFLSDGEHTHFDRSDFIGVAKEDIIPNWAKEKLEGIRTGSSPFETQDIRM